MEKICVAVRVRPANNDASVNGYYWKAEENRISLHKSIGSPISGLSYAFDHVFDEVSTNARVYELLTKDIINAAVDGFNGTAFAYGQTSSGKTFTMNGSENDPGIIHRAVNDIFTITQKIADREFLIRVSYMEIYNEEINDLLSIENQKLPIHESLERGVFVAGLREEIVNSAEQVLKLIQLGEANRHFGETNMNIRSSRSHTIFRMVIESKGKDITGCGLSSDDTIRVSVLNLVDLAGSERIAKTGAEGVRLKEGKHINKSLMILGNVINKLSEGSKQRGHIPYRDSKLTRILQPALGGNAKTSIICTLAPEEDHIEETKGTLQFASRAKRITNCVQVNEILSDAALLKRQKLEIEDLRQKLQGSRAEVLEQEVLNLRNVMLKYELEREKLAMELEEERRSHKERDQCIKEQQMKIDNMAEKNENLSVKEESNASIGVFEQDAFSTPCFKAGPNVSFVAKRSNNIKENEFSPLPDSFNDFADEDTWIKMNKGYIADLDLLHITPARNLQSFSSIESNNDESMEDLKQELEDLKKQLKIVGDERDEMKRNFEEQASLNEELMRKINELQQEALLVQEIPQRFSETVGNCKDIYNDVLSNLQIYTDTEKKSATGKLLSTTSKIGVQLFSILESYFTVALDKNGCIQTIKDRYSLVRERLENSNFVKFDEDSPYNCKNKDYTLSEEIAFWKKKVDNEVEMVKEQYKKWDKELINSNELLEESKKRYYSLEKEFDVVKNERDLLVKRDFNSCEKLVIVSEEREKVLEDLKKEKLRRKNVEEEIKQFSRAFANRQRSLVSFQSEFKSVIENLKGEYQVSLSNSLGY